MANDLEEADFEALDAIVLAYGADRARWPASAATRYGRQPADHPVTVRLLREAAALDRLMADAQSPAETAARPRLVDRIMLALPPKIEVRPASNIIAMRASAAMPRARARPPIRMGAATVLAASLLVGVLAGTAGHDTGLVQDVTARLGISDLVYADNIWAGDVGAAGDEEDTL